MNDLYLLIKSLNHSEKRYFTLSASAMVASKQNNYLKLFQVMDGLKTYDEEALLKKYHNQPFTKNFGLRCERRSDTGVWSAKPRRPCGPAGWALHPDQPIRRHRRRKACRSRSLRFGWWLDQPVGAFRSPVRRAMGREGLQQAPRSRLFLTWHRTQPARGRAMAGNRG